MSQTQQPVTRDEFEQLKDQMDSIQQEIEEERQQRREVEQERDQLQERVQELEETVEQKDREISILESRCDALAEGLERLEGRLEDGDLADDVEAGADPSIERQTPLEDVVALPDEVAERELQANVERARWFAGEIRSAGRKTPMGYQLRAGEIGRLLDVALDVDPHPETVARIISIIDEMGDDETHRRKKEGEKRIVVEEELAKRLEAHSGMSPE